MGLVAALCQTYPRAQSVAWHKSHFSLKSTTFCRWYIGMVQNLCVYKSVYVYIYIIMHICIYKAIPLARKLGINRRSPQGTPLKHSGGRNSKGSSPGPPGRKKKQDGHIPLRKPRSMFYAYLQCSVASVLPRGMGLSPCFFCSLEREPSLWENTWPWEILRIWESFPGIRLGNQDLWGGEKESTFDTGTRVETGTYHWEGRKTFIQTFELNGKVLKISYWFSCCCWAAVLLVHPLPSFEIKMYISIGMSYSPFLSHEKVD